jgi:hypothetical protein
MYKVLPEFFKRYEENDYTFTDDLKLYLDTEFPELGSLAKRLFLRYIFELESGFEVFKYIIEEINYSITQKTSGETIFDFFLTETLKRDSDTNDKHIFESQKKILDYCFPNFTPKGHYIVRYFDFVFKLDTSEFHVYLLNYLKKILYHPNFFYNDIENSYKNDYDKYNGLVFIFNRFFINLSHHGYAYTPSSDPEIFKALDFLLSDKIPLKVIQKNVLRFLYKLISYDKYEFFYYILENYHEKIDINVPIFEKSHIVWVLIKDSFKTENDDIKEAYTYIINSPNLNYNVKNNYENTNMYNFFFLHESNNIKFYIKSDDSFLSLLKLIFDSGDYKSNSLNYTNELVFVDLLSNFYNSDTINSDILSYVIDNTYIDFNYKIPYFKLSNSVLSYFDESLDIVAFTILEYACLVYISFGLDNESRDFEFKVIDKILNSFKTKRIIFNSMILYKLRNQYINNSSSDLVISGRVKNIIKLYNKIKIINNSYMDAILNTIDESSSFS